MLFRIRKKIEKKTFAEKWNRFFDTSSKSFNHKERSLLILIFIICVAHFTLDVQSLIFKPCLFRLWVCFHYTLFELLHLCTVYHVIIIIATMRSIIDVTFTSNGCHILFIDDIFLHWSHYCVYLWLPSPLSSKSSLNRQLMLIYVAGSL